jgi:hypothetical protein
MTIHNQCGGWAYSLGHNTVHTTTYCSPGLSREIARHPSTPNENMVGGLAIPENLFGALRSSDLLRQRCDARGSKATAD